MTDPADLSFPDAQRGELDESLVLLRQVVERSPEADGAWNNIGNVLLELDRDEEAAEAFARSLELVETPDVWANLARAWRRRGAPDRSERVCRRALEMHPDHGAAMHHLALALIVQRRIEEGVDAAIKASELLPEHERRDSLYARVLMEAGERGQAARLLRAWLLREPDSAYAAHQLAACTGQHTPERASDAYVETVFDNFAESFDTTLARLNYCAPDRVTRALGAVLPAAARQLDIADVGCGTGQCGPLLQPWARRLVGCDLSAAMLERAHARGVYDDLQKAELTAFLDGHPDDFDVVVSADTFIYFGDLRGVAGSMRRAVRSGGHVAFSLEAMAASEPGDHVLRPTGRYAHSGGYVRRVLEDAGLQVEAIVCEVLREESHVPVQGWIVTARRP